MLSLENPPWVLEASESHPIRAHWIALESNDAREMHNGNQPRTEWDPQDKSLRPVLETVRKNISIYLGLFWGLNFPNTLFSKLLAFTYPMGWLSGSVPYPKKYRLILLLCDLASASDKRSSILCLSGAVSKVLKDCKVKSMCWLCIASDPTGGGQCHCLWWTGMTQHN